MRTILALLLTSVCALAQFGGLGDPAFVSVLTEPAAGGVCPEDNAPSAENNGATWTRSFGGAMLYAGQSRWTDGGTPRTICKLAFEIGENGTGTNFRAEIHPMTGVSSLDLTALATSDVVAGANWGSGTWVVFQFSTPFTTTASVEYALVVRPVVDMGGNNMALYGDNTAFTGYSDVWNSSGAPDYGSGNDASIRIYWQ